MSNRTMVGWDKVANKVCKEIKVKVFKIINKVSRVTNKEVSTSISKEDMVGTTILIEGELF